MFYIDSSRGSTCAKDPAVIALGDRYLMYYSIPPVQDGRKDDGWGIAVAESRNLDDWKRIKELSFDIPCCAKGFCAPGAIVLDNTVHLFFQSYGNGQNDAICHAVSSDGLNFTADPMPVFKASGNWNCGRAIDADVIAWKDSLLLLTATRDPGMKIQKLVAASAPLGSRYTASDLVQPGDKSILEPELPWEQSCIEAPALCIHNDKLYLFYGGAYNNAPQQIGCAVSIDGVNWRRISDNPVLPCGEPGSWNSSESGHPFVFTAPDGRHHLFFQGNDSNGKTWHLSRREIIWKDDFPCFS